MNKALLALLLGGTAALGACTTNEDLPPPPPPPLGPGAIAGTVASDRNGDGIVDGYYTADGTYIAFQAPPCPPPPPASPRRHAQASADRR